MSSQLAIRYCPHCGARLARDNRDMVCAARQQKVRDEALLPPTVPPEFWETDELQVALAGRHMGRVVYAYRHHSLHGPRALSQETVARWLGITQPQLSRMENGPSPRNLDTLIHWAQILRIPPVYLWFAVPKAQHATGGSIVPEHARINGQQNSVVLPDRPLLVAQWTPESTSSLLETVMNEGVELTPELAVRLAHEWLVTEPPQVIEVAAGRRIGKDLIGKVEQRVEQLRHMDDFVGGHDLYALVEKELCATTYLLEETSYNEALGKRLLATIADLCQLAGWVAADADLHTTAERSYVTGIHAAHAADNAPLAANLISLLSYLYSNTGNPHEAVLLAQTAYTGAQQRSSATTQALLQERVAWAHARAHELEQTKRALGRADDLYERSNPADDPTWVYWLNRDEMDVMAGRCYTELRQPKQAQPLLRRVLGHYNDDMVRETSLYSSWLAESYIQTEDIDEAARLAGRTLLLSGQVNSARAKERTVLLRKRLRPYRHVRAVQDLEIISQDTLKPELVLAGARTERGPRRL